MATTPIPTLPTRPTTPDGPRPTAVLHGAVLVLFWTQALWLWPRLPARIPVHFGAGGTPDRWAGTTLLSWFLLPLVGTGLSALLWGIGRWSVTVPRLWNIPQKERFLALSTEARAPIMNTLRGFMDGMAVAMLVLFDVIQWWTYRTAMGAAPGLPRLFPLIVAAIVVGAVIASVALYVRLQRQILEASRAP